MTRAVSDNAPSCSKALLCALIAFTALTTFAVYWPGLSGPFLFNDYPKILQNNLLKITSLSLENVSRASSSLESGPLRRPVAALSFATNHYFAGSFDSPFTLKATNLVIHILTALTIFWFAYLVVNAIVVPSAHDGEVLVTNARLLVYIAGVTTALWVVHPIQLTSVLYVLQRMASLSALFVFLALVDYVYARQFARAGRMCASVTCFGLAALLAVCGLLSKENAILVLIFVVLTELSLFRDTGYRCKWQMSTRWRKALLITALLTAAIIVLVGSVHYAMPADALRPFLMLERLFTEPRALVFYLSLILLPRSSAFGLFHDDLELSTSLLNPWTTIASIALLVVLIVAAIRLRHRLPLFTFSVVWFFCAHSLDSTFIALELMHKHRNYVASFGVLLALVAVVDMAMQQLRSPLLKFVLPLLLAVFAATTFVRADNWSDLHRLADTQARHHPNSPRTQVQLGVSLFQRRQPHAALEAFACAGDLAPAEMGYRLYQHQPSASAVQWTCGCLTCVHSSAPLVAYDIFGFAACGVGT